MRVIEAELRVTEKGKGIVELPPDVEVGQHHVTIAIPENGGSRQEATQEEQTDGLGFMVLDLGPWPENLSLRREDMYDEWGR